MGVLPHLTDGQGNPIGRKYTILPLDEEVFDINANTRIITVPNSFKTNGISVQGDQVAEIIYFRIDRFFDATDLNEMDIYIQWEAPNGDKGLSLEWVRDIESQPGKIIFGWPLSADITESHGTIKFSVRFYKTGKNEKNENILTYSFSTLMANAVIKPSQDFDLLSNDLFISDNSALIAQRFTNSQVVGGDKAAEPKFFVDLLDKEYDLDENGEYTFAVHAYSTDAGLISYEWYEGNGQNKAQQDETVILPSSIEYRLTEDTSAVKGKIYYTKDEADNFVPESSEISDDLLDKDSPNYVEFYEKFSVCTVNKVGSYYAKASNRLFFNTAAKNSVTAVVPAPVAPVTSNILDNEEKEIKSVILKEGEENEPIEVHVNASKSTEKGILSYQWKKLVEGSATEIDVPGAIESSYIINDIGIYTVEVKNTRNNETKIVRPISSCRVTYEATVPVLHNLQDKYLIGQPIILEKGTNVSSARADDFKYVWKRYFYENGAVKEEVVSENNSLIPNSTDDYAVYVYSVYNGNISEAAVHEFTVGVSISSN